MADIFEYLNWRGDLTFDQDSFNEVDNIILSRLSYLSYEDIVAEEITKFISLKEIADNFIINPENAEYSLFENDYKLLQRAGNTDRFKDIKVSGYINKKDYIDEKQFAAIVFKLSEEIVYISYRGTDNTSLGWKENFNMLYKYPVPSQIEALKYLEKVASSLPQKLIVGGHSKGGNLAVYGAVFSSSKTKDRILAVYNNDGPGFRKEIIETDKFLKIEDRIHTLIPESSIVGMMLERKEDYSIIESNGISILQHNLYLWKVYRNKFIYLEEVKDGSKFVNKSMKYWLENMDDNQIEIFVNTLFGVLDESGELEIKKMNRQWYEGAKSIISSLVGTDEETKKAVQAAIQVLFKSAEENLGKNKKIKKSP